MANEIRSRLHMQFVLSGLTPNLSIDFKRYTKQIDMSGSESSRLYQVAPTSIAILLDIGPDITTQGIILVQNMSAYYVALGSDNMRVACSAVANNGSGKARYAVTAHGMPGGSVGLAEHTTFADSNYNGSKITTYVDADHYDVAGDTFTADDSGETDSIHRGVSHIAPGSFTLVRNNGTTFYILASLGEANIEAICLED